MYIIRSGEFEVTKKFKKEDLNSDYVYNITKLLKKQAKGNNTCIYSDEEKEVSRLGG